MSERIPVIYIVSNGRSGSTLLDLLLGAHPEIWTLGELQHLRLWRDEGRLCGCGAPLNECPYWAEVLPKLDLEGAPVPLDRFRDNNHQGRVVRFDHALDLLTGHASAQHLADARAYGELNVEVFSAARDAAEAQTGQRPRWLVDASKDPYRLLWLEASGLFDLRVLHIVKDPRAFVWSMTRRPGTGSAKRRVRFTGRWAVENAIMARLVAALGERGRIVRYEALASDPEGVMKDLGTWLGTGYPAEGVTEFRRAPNHAVSGNQMRWDDRPVRLDESWRKGLSPREAWSIWAATLPTQGLLRALG